MVNLFQSICFKFYPGFPTRGNIFHKIIVARFGGGGKGRDKKIKKRPDYSDPFKYASANAYPNCIIIIA